MFQTTNQIIFDSSTDRSDRSVLIECCMRNCNLLSNFLTLVGVVKHPSKMLLWLDQGHLFNIWFAKHRKETKRMRLTALDPVSSAPLAIKRYIASSVLHLDKLGVIIRWASQRSSKRPMACSSSFSNSPVHISIGRTSTSVQDMVWLDAPEGPHCRTRHLGKWSSILYVDIYSLCITWSYKFAQCPFQVPIYWRYLPYIYIWSTLSAM